MNNLIKPVAVIIFFFLSLFVYSKLAGPLPLNISMVATTKSDTFTVGGTGKISVSPDLATLSAGVTATGPTVKAAQDNLNGKINAVSEAIKGQGVDKKDIQTANYSIYPQYDYRGTPNQITGYNASSTLTIKVRNIEKANGVLDAATAAGANVVGGISFEVSDKTKAENQARNLAVADAKSKAENAAKIAGFSLGRIINYSENFGGEPRPMPVMEKAAGLGAGPATQVEPGTNEITVTVSLSYEIR